MELTLLLHQEQVPQKFGGFNVRESQIIIRALNNINFIGGDVVEVSPPFDTNNMTSYVAATIAFEILCTMTKTN